MAKFYYGGQAVIEGVMMRGRSRMAVAVRHPKGHIVVHQEPLTAKIYTSSWGKLPFIRGLSLLWDTLGLGMRALMFSAEVVANEDENQKIEFTGPLGWTTVAGSLIFAVAIFFLIPSFLSQRLIHSTIGAAVVEGIIRLVFFLAYLAAIGRLPEVKRLFAYHGAEHKTINAFEAGARLEPSVVKAYSVQHTRCGTSFLLFVLLISIVVFAPFHFDNVILRLLSRVILIPVVAMISYELIRFSADHQRNPLMRLIIAPGLALQRLTTREPDEQMLEVAIAALQPVLAADGIRVLSSPAAEMIRSVEPVTGAI